MKRKRREMAKSNSSLPSVSEIPKDLKKGNLLPLYYICGEDSFSIDETITLIDKAVQPHLATEFDREVFYGEKNSLSDVLQIAAAFPFGSGKKFLIYRDFEKQKDKKALASYADSPPDFTILLITHTGKISSSSSEPYKTLLSKGFLFEARELKGKYLADWVVNYTENHGKIISNENALNLIDIVGENRAYIEDQLEKIFIFLEDKKEVTFESIIALSTRLKQYTIYNLQDALSSKNKKESLKLAFHLVENGLDVLYIINFLGRYFAGLSRLNELTNAGKSDGEIAKDFEIPPFAVTKMRTARTRFSDKELFRAAKALLAADVAVKTSASDAKSILITLMSEILRSDRQPT